MSLKQRLNLSDEPVYLIDGSAFVYRGFYAFKDMSRSDGFPTNALFSVVRLMFRLLTEERPSHMIFILDGKGKGFRNDIYEAYKANRQATPEDLVAQIDPIKEALELLGIPVYVAEGGEADDCIASLAARYKKQRPVVIVGTDKDLKQCLDDNVWLWDPSGKKEKLVSLSEFEEDTGMTPANWPDFQAIIGDSADNIPGIPGVGPKTAEKVMVDYKTLEEIRDNFDKLPPAFQKKAADHMEIIFDFRELTTLRLDFCSDLEDDGIALRPVDPSVVNGFFQEYELRSLARDFKGVSRIMLLKDDAAAATESTEKAVPKSKNAGGAAQMSLFGAAGPTGKADEKDINTAGNISELPDSAGLKVGMVPQENGFRLGVNNEEWFIETTADTLVPWLQKAELIATPSVKTLFSESEVWEKIPLAQWFDIGLAAYLLSPEERNYAWERLSSQLRYDPMIAETPAGADGVLAVAAAELLQKKLDTAHMTELMGQLEMPLIAVLVGMEREGIAIDKDAFNVFLREVNDRIAEQSTLIYKIAGCEFNIRSSQQLAEILFQKLGLKPRGKTPGGQPSTSSTVLEKLAGEHELIGHILEFRMLEKLRSTYLEPLPKLAGKDGRIHTTFNNMATATGRLSSIRPNLQNIPIRGELGPRMRGCFTATPGNLLAAADYSQIELRVLADLSGDETLLAAFREGADIHQRTASLIFEVAPEEVTREQRGRAKTVNFGLLYGMGPRKLAQDLKVSMTEAKDFIARYFEKLSGLKRFYEQVEEDARRDQYVTTITGRRRLLPEINSRNDNLRSQARRQAVNTRIQGSAADIIKMAMLKVANDDKLSVFGARLLLQIHDELILEVPEAQAQVAGERLAKLMSGVMELKVPLVVDCGVGRTWAEAH